jgi:phosphatidylinositol glycan class A protein
MIGRKRIAMVCDFFFPSVGGVENHVHQLAAWLVRRGHKVVVVTRDYTRAGEGRGRPGGRRWSGVRWLRGGVKVYHAPVAEWWRGAALPTVVGAAPVLREILVRERVEVVHAHQAVSTLAQEALVVARALGIAAVFTDHSLVGFAELGAIALNSLLEFALADAQHVICVSHTCKENLVLRTNLSPDMVAVIPNSLDIDCFLPRADDETGAVDETVADDDGGDDGTRWITVVMLSRLVYRKGLDLAVEAIPAVCARFPQVRFVIGGDGPKRLALDEMCERHGLGGRVELLGEVAHECARDVLVRGDVFLNCSLTEGFCIAIVEAASCGLAVVSTRVGGIPEVLPPHMIRYAEPTSVSIIDTLTAAITAIETCDDGDDDDDRDKRRQRRRQQRRWQQHREVRALYNWENVAQRTERVYDMACSQPHESSLQRYSRYRAIGPVAGVVWCVVAAIVHVVVTVLEWLSPRSSIDIAKEMPRTATTCSGWPAIE